MSTQVATLINCEYGIEVADAPKRPQDLVTDAEMIEDLTRHPGYELMLEYLDRLAEMALLDLDTGLKPAEQAQYAQKHGFRNGLRVPADVTTTFLAKAEKAIQALNEAERASERT